MAKNIIWRPLWTAIVLFFFVSKATFAATVIGTFVAAECGTMVTVTNGESVHHTDVVMKSDAGEITIPNVEEFSGKISSATVPSSWAGLTVSVEVVAHDGRYSLSWDDISTDCPPTPVPTETPTVTVTSVQTDTVTPSPTPTETPTVTVTPVQTDTVTPSPTPTETPTEISTPSTPRIPETPVATSTTTATPEDNGNGESNHVSFKLAPCQSCLNDSYQYAVVPMPAGMGWSLKDQIGNRRGPEYIDGPWMKFTVTADYPVEGVGHQRIDFVAVKSRDGFANWEQVLEGGQPIAFQVDLEWDVINKKWIATVVNTEATETGCQAVCTIVETTPTPIPGPSATPTSTPALPEAFTAAPPPETGGAQPQANNRLWLVGGLVVVLAAILAAAQMMRRRR